MASRVDVIHVYLAEDPAGEESELIERLFANAERKVRFVDRATLPPALDAIEVLVCGAPPKIDDWRPARRLRLLHTLGAGVDGLLPAAGLRPEVIIANARGIHAAEMRDHVLAMLLAFARQLPRALAQQATGTWAQFTGRSLSGQTAVVLGLGEVGAPIASACAALGMHVLGVRRDPDLHDPIASVEVFGPMDLPVVLARADAVVLALPLTPSTRGLIDQAAIARMRTGAVLVNVSRGGIVDEAALVDALVSGHLGGAALDVFAEEPLPPSSALWKTRNLIITPHMAGWMPDYLRRAVGVVLENLERLERGEPVRTPVDRARQY